MPGRWPTVGRGEERELIAAVFGNAEIRCVLLSGTAGVGKTRLARDVAGWAEERHRRVHWTAATGDTSDIPLGALTDLLPADLADQPSADRFEILARAQRALSTVGSRLLIAIDDAPLLDEISAALVQQLVAGGEGARVLLTARSDEMPDWLAHLARDDRVEHLRLEPLAESEVHELVDAVLPGSVDAAVHAMLWTQSGGNPLWLRQLIQDGLDSGALAQGDGVWTWSGPVGAASLSDVLAARLDGLRAFEREAVDLVALAEPLPAPVAAHLDLSDTLVALERRALVTSDGAGVRVAHPLLGTLLRERMDPGRARAVRGTLVAAFRARGLRHGTDELRLARWHLESGDTSDPDLMVTGSRRSLVLDPLLAERFARAALTVRPDPAARYALARALLDQARLTESAQVYADLLTGPLPPEQWAEAMMDSAYFALWVHGDAAAGMAQLREVEQASKRFAPQAASLRSAIALFSGATDEAIDAGLPITQTASVNPSVLHLAAVAVVPALTLAGRVGDAVALAERTRLARAEMIAEQPAALVGPTYRDAQLGWEYAQALRYAGRIDEAIADATERLGESAAEAERHPESYGLRNAALGGALLAAGDVRAALDSLRVGASVMRHADQVGTLVSCLADLACAEALAGDLRTAEAVLSEAAGRRHPAVHVFESDLGRAGAVVTACGGDRDGARRQALAAAETARRWGQPVPQAAGLHLAACLGGAAEVVDPLTDLAARLDAQLVAVFAAHARAEAAGDAGALVAVADRFAEAGALWHAASAAAGAARRYRAAGRGAEATRTAQRSRAWSARCPGAPVPSLRIEPEPLTAREREVVVLARDGQSNAEIAATLVISARTVESHLQHAFAKLGVTARRDLVGMPLGAG